MTGTINPYGEALAEFVASTSTTSSKARHERSGGKFPETRIPDDRKFDMARRVANGETYESVASSYRVTPPLIRQNVMVVMWFLGVQWVPGRGKSAGIKVLRPILKEAIDRFDARCDVAQF